MNHDQNEAPDRQQITSEPLLRVSLFGPLRLCWLVPTESDEDAWHRRTSACALFCLLLCAPQRRANRSQLAAALWPEVDEPRAIESLRVATRALRTVLRPASREALLHSLPGGLLQLADQTRMEVDLDTFEALGQQASTSNNEDEALALWEQARVLVCGEFLADHVRGSEWSTHRWIKIRQRDFNAARRRMICALADSSIQRGQLVQAELLLQGHVNRFPGDQDAVFRLVTLLLSSERTAEARESYQRCKAALASSGKQPAEHLQALEAHFRTHAERVTAQGIQPLHTLPHPSPVAQRVRESVYEQKKHRSLMSLLEPHKLQEACSSLPSDIPDSALLPPTLGSTDELLDRFIRALKKPSTMNETTCRYIEARTDAYWKDHYDAIFAPSDLLSDALGQFQKVISLLENSLLPTVRTRLCASASRIAQFAGALYFDMGNYTYSKRYRQVAILAAREAEHQELEAVAWGRLSMTCMYGNRLQDALISIQEARRLATQSSSFRVHAWLAAVEAEIQAKQGNREACLQALDVAECVENIQPSDQDAHWLHFDRPSLIGFQGACYRRLYRPDDPQTHGFLEEARKALLTTLSLPTLTQRRPTTLADLADTYLLQGEVGEACNLASQAVAVIAELQSGRNLQRLLTLRHAMEPWKDTRDIQDLDRQLTALDEQLAPLFS